MTVDDGSSEPSRGPGLPPLPLATCANCGNDVPVGAFCGVCGAHLLHPDDRLAAARPHFYSAFPEEGVIKAAVATTLFPHLSHRSMVPFRVALSVLGVLLVAFSLASVEPAVIALSALGVPLLFGLYLHEVDVYHDNPLFLGLVTLFVGAGLGVGWALLAGPLVAGALQPTLGSTLTGSRALEAAIAVPLVGQALMCVPVSLLATGRRRSGEALDGFAIGAGGALGFTFAAILTNLASQLSAGVTSGESFTSLLGEALIRGISQPIVAAGTTGLVGAAMWLAGGERLPRRAGWVTSPILAFVLAVAVQVGLGFADQGRLTDLVLVVVHLAAAVVVLVALRIGLHLILLRESHDVRVGPARICPHCHHVTPQMAFCPECGVASAATAKQNRLELPVGVALAATEGADGPAGPPSWPTAPADSAEALGWTGYPLVPAVRSPEAHRARHRVVLSAFLAGLTVLVVALVVIAVLERPTAHPITRCHLLCPGLVASPRASSPYVPSGFYTSSMFSVLTPQFPDIYPKPDVSQGSAILSITYKSAQPVKIPSNGKNVTVNLSGGTVQFAGISAGSMSAEQLVDEVETKIAPNAVLKYQIPDAFVGYQLGYGAVYDVQANSTTGAGQDLRLLLMAAVRNGVGVVVLAEGPYDSSFAEDPLLDHPAFVDLDVALFLDSSINSVRWSAEQYP